MKIIINWDDDVCAGTSAVQFKSDVNVGGIVTSCFLPFHMASRTLVWPGLWPVAI
jgi:hypothetical protein